jgi:hypothetical protein
MAEATIADAAPPRRKSTTGGGGRSQRRFASFEAGVAQAAVAAAVVGWTQPASIHTLNGRSDTIAAPASVDRRPRKL